MPYAEIAFNYRLWCDCCDPYYMSAMPEQEFDAMTLESRIALLEECFGPETEDFLSAFDM